MGRSTRSCVTLRSRAEEEQQKKEEEEEEERRGKVELDDVVPSFLSRG